MQLKNLIIAAGGAALLSGCVAYAPGPAPYAEPYGAYPYAEPAYGYGYGFDFYEPSYPVYYGRSHYYNWGYWHGNRGHWGGHWRGGSGGGRGGWHH